MTDDLLRERSQIREARKFATYRRLAERDGAVCQHCGAAEDLTIDHVDPKGGNQDSNLQLLCTFCNSSKSDRTDEKTVRFASGIWQAGFTIVPNVVLTNSELSPLAFRIYALLLKYARESEECWPGQDGLGEVAGLSSRSVRTGVRELEKARLIRTRRRGLGQTNVYVILDPRCRSRAEDFSGQERKTVPVPLTLSKKTQLEEETSLVVAAWKASSPPLIEHRDAYFDAQKAKTAIRTATRIYPGADVAAAVANYATVLGSPDYTWSYRWTLIDFLRRGLDRFVPEAEPLTNFRSFGKKRDDYDLSGVDQLG